MAWVVTRVFLVLPKTINTNLWDYWEILPFFLLDRHFTFQAAITVIFCNLVFSSFEPKIFVEMVGSSVSKCPRGAWIPVTQVGFPFFHFIYTNLWGVVLYCAHLFYLDFLESFSIFVVMGILVVHFSIIYNIRVQYVFVRNGYKAVGDSLVEED